MGQSDSKLTQYRDHIFQLADPGVIPLYSPSALPRDIIRCYNDPLSRSGLESKIEDGSGGAQPEEDLFSSVFSAFTNSDAEAHDVYSVVSTQELRLIFQSNQLNFVNLVRFIAFKIHALAYQLQRCDGVDEFRVRRAELLCSVRIMTKIMPVFFEMDTDQSLEDSLFWSRDSSQALQCEELSTPVTVTKLNVNHTPAESQAVVPLGVALLQACVKLLFMQGFTLPLSRPQPDELGKVSFLLWENGINTSENNYRPPSPKLDSNRLEVLRLLLTISSKELYSSNIPKFLCVLTTSLPEFHLICLSSSLLNLVCRSCRNNEDNNGLNYPPSSYHTSCKSTNMRALRKALAVASAQLLNLSLLCPIEGPKRSENYLFLYGLNLYSTNYEIKNLVSSYLGTLNREFDLKFVLISLVTLLKRPIDQAIENESNPFSLLNGTSNTSAKQGKGPAKKNGHSRSNSAKGVSNKSNLTRLPRATLQIMTLFWELMKCNKAFENYVADKYANKLLLVCLFYIKYYSDSPDWRTSLIPAISGFAIYLSSKKLVVSKMSFCFNVNYYTNKLPNFFKLSVGDVSHLTYRDFAIIHLSNIAIRLVHENMFLDPSLIEIIYNLLPMAHEKDEGELVQLSSERSYKLTGLSYNACVALLQLISKMTSKNYLTTFAGEKNSTDSSGNSSETTVNKTDEKAKPYAFSPGFKLDTLALLLHAFNGCIFNYFRDSKHLLFVLCRHARVVQRLDEILQEISSEINYVYDRQESRVSLKSDCLFVSDFFDDSLPYDVRINQTNMGLQSYGGSEYSLMEKAQLQSLFFFDAEKPHPEEVEATAERIANGSPNKTIELFEHSDKEYNSVLDSTELLFALRPIRPFGLSFKSKLKTRKEAPLKDSWLGSQALSTLKKCIEIVNQKFPEIPEVTTATYVPLLRKLLESEGILKDELSHAMPYETKIKIKVKNPLLIRWDHSEEASRWFLSILWADVFNYNSVPFISAYTKENSQQDAFLQHQNQSLSQPQTPRLERHNSQGSSLSRTNSNSSSISTFFLHQEPESASNSAPNSPSVGSSFSSWLNNKYQSGNQSNERSSLFRFSWAGFQKNPQDEKICEEISNQPEDDLISPESSFVLDMGLLKPNIWVGTRVELFKTKVDERENYSLMEMTSNFLRKLRLGNSWGVNAPDGVMVTPGTLAPGTARSWTPRNSMAANGTASLQRHPNGGSK
ncbi:LAQU0S01e01090g1_1 [Lachancea quebecensis]|uniref:LAQU0S01e01090g1_1 n=1 Tax=Lachancea quebecensis TaxID=1654605 RepID=A0A0P1KLK3_9SACH|nr:LAQU0S01e01090g1_1 [Lachancea quebecensis]